MAEEHNRIVTDHLSSLLLTHSEDANQNLATEGITGDRTAFVGNTMIDTLLESVAAAQELSAWQQYAVTPKNYLLVTLHRPALVDDSSMLRKTMQHLGSVAASIPVIFPSIRGPGAALRPQESIRLRA